MKSKLIFCQLQVVNRVSFSFIFSDASILTNQVATSVHKTPAGVNVHVCEVCHKVFPYNSNLVRHMVVHTRDKPYACACGKRYSDLSGLRYHQQTLGHRKQDGLTTWNSSDTERISGNVVELENV